MTNALHVEAVLAVFDIFLLIKMYNLGLKFAMATANIWVRDHIRNISHSGNYSVRKSCGSSTV